MGTKRDDPVLTVKYWTDNQMRSGEWYTVKLEQSEAFKSLIDERYGWPQYVLNFNTGMNQIMKVENGREKKSASTTV